MYRLFFDEVGHHNLSSANDPNERYLCLVGVILDLDYSMGEFTNAMNAIKMEVFGTSNVVLHRRELIDKKPAPFDKLADPDIKKKFDSLMIDLITKAKYTVITVLIDKKRHVEKYGTWQFQPYHYCLTAMVERYVWWLDERGAVGDVMAEGRDRKQDMKLEAAYKYLYRNGTGTSAPEERIFVSAELMQKRLSSGEIKMRTKSSNVPGLQLADLIANPARRHIVCKLEKTRMSSQFGRRIVRILIDMKYRRCKWGNRQIVGFGVKVLPEGMSLK
jgi:Protein of unknown function (DUF3800)